MLQHRSEVLGLGTALVVAGALVFVFAKPLIRIVSARQRSMYGRLGEQFASRLAPWNYRLAGGVIVGVGIGLLLLGILAH